MIDTFYSCKLQRWPHYKRETLQPFDAADDLLVQHYLQQTPQHLLVINDNFGAISLALSQRHRISWLNDSYLSEIALAKNLENNPQARVGLFDPSCADLIDGIVMRIPKTMSDLHLQLAGLKHLSKDSIPIAMAGMFKHLPRNLQQQLHAIEPLQRSQITRKAQLYHGLLQLKEIPSLATKNYNLKQETLAAELKSLNFANAANVFASSQLDIGSRFLLQHLPTPVPVPVPVPFRIADLGCGNGVLGIALAKLNPQAEVDFFDQSYCAIQTCALNLKLNSITNEYQCFVADGFNHPASSKQQRYDLIVCNPPFHQGHQVTELLALRLFEQSRQQLNKGGELRIVANRHLSYQKPLRRLFGGCRQIAANSKFVILSASHQ